jgi:hypothetical protein
VRDLPDRRAVRLHPDRVDHRVRPAAVCLLANRVAEIRVVLVQVDRLDPEVACALQPLGDEVDGDHAVAPMVRDPRAHVADRAETEHDDGAAVRDARVLDRLPAGRQHVGEVDEAVVRRAFRHPDRAVVREGDAQELGLSARDLAV